MLLGKPSGPVAVLSHKFDKIFRTDLVRTNKNPYSKVPWLIRFTFFSSVSVFFGRWNLDWKDFANKSAFHTAIKAHLPSSSRNGGILSGQFFFTIRVLQSFHHFFEEDGKPEIFAFMRMAWLWNSSCSPLLQASRASLYSGVPSAACFLATKSQHFSLSQAWEDFGKKYSRVGIKLFA